MVDFGEFVEVARYVLAGLIIVIVFLVLYNTCIGFGTKQFIPDPGHEVRCKATQTEFQEKYNRYKSVTTFFNLCQLELFIACLVFCVILLDFLSDILTAINFFYKSQPIAGGLTIGIVVVGGYLVTLTQYAYGYFLNKYNQQ